MIIRGSGTTGAEGRAGGAAGIGATFDGDADCVAAEGPCADGAVCPREAPGRGGIAIAGGVVVPAAGVVGALETGGATGTFGGITTTDGGR